MILRQAGKLFLTSFFIVPFGLALSGLYARAAPSALRLSRPTVPLYFEVKSPSSLTASRTLRFRVARDAALLHKSVCLCSAAFI